MKTILTKVHLINWYGFIDEIIPISPRLTLISGENECGKSTILDAIKYAYTGDTLFNKSSAGASQGIGKRTVFSYTRCLLDASASIYARSPEDMPTVYTHIALEYLNELENRSFVLGVIIETSTSDIRTSDWYAMDGMNLDRLELTYEEDGVTKPYGKELFQKKYKIPMMGKHEGIEKFMQMVGLKLPYQEVTRYQRKLRNIMTYNPEAKIREFIKESVLEEYDINFSKLRDAKNNIDEITRKLSLIEREIDDLESILDGFDKVDKVERRLAINKIKTVYRDVKNGQQKLDEITATIEKEALEIESNSRDIAALDERYAKTNDLYMSANRELQESDVARAITTSKQMVESLEAELNRLDAECKRIAGFQDKLDGATDLMTLVDDRVDLTSSTVSAAEKESYVIKLRNIFNNKRDEYVSDRALVHQRIESIDLDICHEKDVIIACDKNKTDYSYAKDQVALVGEINREFDRQGISGRARLACEYVVGLKDESWRDAIEAFLGVHRFAVIVDAEYFSIAEKVMDASHNRYVELVNTPYLMRKKWTPDKDSVYEKLDIKNESAAAYFCFWLGRIRATTKDDVAKHMSAMSKEGKLSRNMAVTYINMRKLKTYCLGSEAIALNKKRAEKRIKELSALMEEELATEAGLISKIEQTDDVLSEFREYDWSAPSGRPSLIKRIDTEKMHLDELLDAQKNNAEFIALSERVARLRDEVDTISKERATLITASAKLEGKMKNDKDSERVIRYKLDEDLEIFDEMKGARPSIAEKAVTEYDAYLAGDNPSGDVIKRESLERTESRLNQIMREVEVKQTEYNNRNAGSEPLPIGTQYEAEYQNRRNRIWVDDLQSMQEKFKETTEKYESIFKREFVLTVYEKSQTAMRDLRDINMELRKLKFSTQYRFEVKFLDDGSDYHKIITYAKYLQDTNNLVQNGQQTLTEAVGIDSAQAEEHEAEIKEIINRLIELDDDKEIKKYADYRNYMNYEIIINNDDVKDGKLSKQMGYNSGAGTQIPYTLILSASLSMLYNVRANSTRLVFIDEPFEKMSDENIEKMLDFFKSQDFQVVFCAPPNKLEAIGTECEVIIPVIKYKNDDMKIGQVRFY